MAKKKRVGRPPLPKDQRHMATVSFRMLKSERKLIGDAAKESGETLSDWIRATLIGVAEAASLERRRDEESNPSAGTSSAP